MQTVKQGQLTLALLSRIPPLLRIYCLLLHWGFYTKPKKLLPVSTIFNIFLAVEWAFFSLPPPLVSFHFAGASHQDWAVKCVAARSFYSAWTLFSDLCGYKTCLAKKKKPQNQSQIISEQVRRWEYWESVCGVSVFTHTLLLGIPPGQGELLALWMWMYVAEEGRGWETR